jgi:hypothetical protein
MGGAKCNTLILNTVDFSDTKTILKCTSPNTHLLFFTLFSPSITQNSGFNKLPGYIKEIDSYKTFKKELKSLLLLHSFYSVEEFVAV